MSVYNYIAKTYPGLEEPLARELENMGASDVAVLGRAVSFSGTLPFLYEANYRLRTALRILMHLKSGTIFDNGDLYNLVSLVPWEEWFLTSKTIAVDSVVINNSTFSNTVFVSQKVKDAVVDRFREIGGVRPTVDLKEADIRIHVHISGDNCDILLDSTGDSLHRRGYKITHGPAPLSEVLAAGLIYLSGWDQKTPFFDPMCGSGTILAEAAMIALDVPPAKLRNSFCFTNWLSYKPEDFREVKSKAAAYERKHCPEIMGFDIEPKAVHATRANINAIGLAKFVHAREADFFKEDPPFRSGFILTNPPYGVKIVPESLDKLYSDIGQTLKRKYAGYTASIISGYPPGFFKIGMKHDMKISIPNGPIDCSFRKYSIFQGKRADFLDQAAKNEISRSEQ